MWRWHLRQAVPILAAGSEEIAVSGHGGDVVTLDHGGVSTCVAQWPPQRTVLAGVGRRRVSIILEVFLLVNARCGRSESPTGTLYVMRHVFSNCARL